MKLIERIQGSLLGCAIGDALGFPVEFQKVEGGSRTILDLPEPALYSDDTQMTLAVAKGLLRSAGSGDSDYCAGLVAEEFIRWANDPETPGRAPGNACLFGCEQLARGVHWSSSGKVDAEGCGTAMRSAPYGWFFYDYAELAAGTAATHALMTHESNSAMASAAAVAMGVARALEEESPKTIVESMILSANDFDQKTAAYLRFALEAAQWGAPPARVLNFFQGWVGHEAVAGALYCFLTHPEDYREAVLLAINSPGDSDSLGAITGALSGAYLGINALPPEWVERIEKRDMLIELARQCAAVIGEEDESGERGSQSETATGDGGAREAEERKGRPALRLPRHLGDRDS